MLLNNFYINILVKFIINNYLENGRCLLIFSNENFDYMGDIPIVRIKALNGSFNSHLIFHYHGCQSVIIYTNNITALLIKFETEIRLKMERFNKRKFLIVPQNPSKNFETDFFNLEQLYFISDLLLVLPTNHDTIFDLKTHKYVGLSDNNEPVLIDRWFANNQSFLFGKNLYPNKLQNQLGRPLKMATFTYEPYSIIGNLVKQFSPNHFILQGNSAEDHHGSELLSSVLFALKYNMTPVPVINEKDYWGDIFPNWSGNGLLGNLVEDKADVGFSALYTWEFCYHFLELSKPLVRTGITCLVPAPKLSQRWLTPLFSYSSHLWFCVILTLVVAIFVLSLVMFCYNHNKIFNLKYSPKPKTTYIYFLKSAVTIVLKPVFQQSVSLKRIPVEVASKFLMGLMLILDLFLTSSYSSGLATVMTIPTYENAINTVEDLANSGLDWGATQDAWIMSIQHTEEPNYIKIVSKFHPISEEELLKFSKSGQFGFSIERLPSENYAIGNYITEDTIDNFHVMKEDLYWEQCVMMLRKNSVLLPALDLFILKMFEAGLISHWQNEAVDLYMNAKVQKAVKFYKSNKGQEKKAEKLQWSHVEGPFALLLIGYIVSITFFILELTIMKTGEKQFEFIM